MAAVLAVLGRAPVVLAQAGPPTPGQSAAPNGSGATAPPPAVGAAAAQPLGPPAPAAKAPAEPQPKPGELWAQARSMYLDHKDRRGFLEGDVVVHYHDLVIRGPKIWLDQRLEKLWTRDPTTVHRADGFELAADQVDGAYAKDHYTSGAFDMTVPPAVAGHGLSGPIYVRGESSDSEMDQRYLATRLIASTCPLGDLKYHLTAKSMDLIPDDRLILRSAKMFIFGVPVFAWSKLVIPLRPHRKPDTIPDWGHDDVYGYWVRYRYYYDFLGGALGDVMVMATEKRGFFLGDTQNFDLFSPDWEAKGHVEFQYGTRYHELLLRGDLSENFGRQTQLVLNGGYSSNSGYATASNQSNLTGSLTHTFDLGKSTLSYSRSATDASSSFSAFTHYTLNQTLKVGQLFNADLNADWSFASASTNTVTDQQLATRFRFNGAWTLFDWEVLDQRRFLLANQAASTVSMNTDIVPQVTLHTDSHHLDLGLQDLLQMRLDTTVGEYRVAETSTAAGSTTTSTSAATTTSYSTILRSNFDLNANLSQLPLGPSALFTLDSQYSQSFFDHPSPSAKYVLSFDPAVQWKPTDTSRFDLKYSWQKPSGYSPLTQMDFTQSLNEVDLTYNWFLPDPVRPRTGRVAFTVQGGRDLLAGFWRDLDLSLKASPIDEMMINLQGVYAVDGRGIGDAGLRTIQGQLLYDAGQRYHHEIGLTYDSRNHRLSTLSSLVRLQMFKHLSLQHALTYDGTQHQITYDDIMANWDMGCVGISAYYSQENDAYGLNFNISALPALGTIFGTGRYGGQFSTSQGVSF